MIGRIRHGVFVLLLMMMAHHLHAQWRSPRIIHLGPAEGIASWTFNITQDKTGFMYFGTDQGLVRYNGHEFILFAHDPADQSSIGPGDVWDLITGSDSLIWMASRLSGLNVFDPRSGAFTRYATPAAEELDFDALFAVYEDPQQQLWLGGSGYRLLLFNRQLKSFVTYMPDWVAPQSNPYMHYIARIFQDVTNPDLLWLSIRDVPTGNQDKNSNYTLASFHKKHKQFELYPCWGKPCHQDTSGKLWLVARQINVFDPRRMTCKTLDPLLEPNPIQRDYEIRDLLPVENDFIVVAPDVIFSMDRAGKGEVLSQSDGLGTPMRIFSDRQANTWFGRTNGISVLRSNSEQIQFYSLEEHQVHGRIFPGKVAYDAHTETVFVVDHAAGSSKRKVISIPHNTDTSHLLFNAPGVVGGVAVDTRGTLWAFYDGAFHAITGPNKKNMVSSMECDDHLSNVWTVASNKDGWIGGLSYDKFVWFHETGLRCKSIALAALQQPSGDKRVDFQGLWYTDNNRVLLFSNEIYEIDLVTGQHVRLRMQASTRKYPQADLHSVIVDTAGNYWIATLSMTGQFERQGDSLLLLKTYSTADGMNCAWVHELYPDAHGRIWAFAQNGINVIDPALQEVRYFGVHEGLADACTDPRQVLTLSDGRIVTVNGNGLIFFHPDSLWHAYTPQYVPVIISAIRIAGKSLESDMDVNQITHLTLSTAQDYLDIQFQGLAYPTDYNLHYSYLVEGLSSEWISIGENKIVTLSSLRPGKYVLKIKAGNPSSTTPVKTINIHKQKPVTQQAWFIVLCSLGVAAIALTAYRWRINRVRNQEMSKAAIAKQMAELELQALRSQMNPHFMFNSLNSIKNYILQSSPKLAADYLSNFAHLIRLILQNSRKKAISLQSEIETLMLYVELEQIRFDHKFEFTCKADDDINLQHVMIPPMLLQPFVENAIWHGLMPKKGKGRLQLSFIQSDDKVACIIEDDGIGRQQAAANKSLSATKYKSMGMGITRDRIEIMNKMSALGITADVIDQCDADGKGIGTKVVVKIPVTSTVELY